MRSLDSTELLGEDEEEEAPQARGAAWREARWAAAPFAAGLLACLAAAAHFARLSGAASPYRSSASQALQVKEATWEPEFPTQCGKTDVDVEYVDEESGWGVNYDHIPTPEMCCAMCQGVHQCKAFTWVKDAGLDGCPSQCWLKGGTGTSRPKMGLVSGVPPEKKGLGILPPAASQAPNTLFCFSLMVPGTDEQKLLAWQYEHKASIFACDDFAVYSNVTIKAVGDVTTRKVDSDLKCEYGGDSMSALNAWIFIAVFDKMLDDGVYRKHGWTVKADPDAVFFPDRLIHILQDHQGAGYLNNCKYGMHGPIEVFSRAAMDTLAQDYKDSWDGKAPNTCVKDLDFGQWGEDMFLDQCLHKVLGVQPSPPDERLMCEAHCDCPAWYWCTNGTDRVSFHPFKSVDSYENCVSNALGKAGIPPTTEPQASPALRASASASSASGAASASASSASGAAIGKAEASPGSGGAPVAAHTSEEPQVQQCGAMDEDVEYQDEASGFSSPFNHIPTAEMCCALCQGVPRCAAFTWVKDAGLGSANPGQCWLKGAIGSPVGKPGVTSGTPPARIQLFGVPAGTGGPGGSLFCFTLMMPTGLEPGLLQWQYKMKASIFACDEFAVYSNQAIQIAPGIMSYVVDSDLHAEYGGDSNSALNSWIFIAVWKKLTDDGFYAQHDWVVKVDPDTVFFPDRLSRLLAEHKGSAYINNCRYGLHGPIEVVSRDAISALAADYQKSWDKKAPFSCVQNLQFGEWGEDMFLDQCLSKVLQVGKAPIDPRLLCESHCDCPAWYWCNNGTDRVAFHPFKSVDAYSNCMANALAAEASQPAANQAAQSGAAGGSFSHGGWSGFQPGQEAGAGGTAAATAQADAGASAAVSVPVPAPPPPGIGPQAMHFYVYRAQSHADYPLENLNVADLPGVMWYLHNEVVVATPRKYKIDRIKRYMVTVKNTWEFWNVHHRQFGAFVAYDAARCTTPVCGDIYNQYGFIVGCQVVDITLGGYRGKKQTTWSCEKGADECFAPLWFALPGECPLMGMENKEINPNSATLDVNAGKTDECKRKMPGGQCDLANGAPDCTYNYEDAGEIKIDDLVGIEDYHEFWNTSYVKCEEKKAQHEIATNSKCVHQKEYVLDLDKGVGTDFWNGKFDKAACDLRMEAVTKLFKKRYPDLPEDLETPACDFDMYYKDEFTWDQNHTGAAPSSYWDNRMPVTARAASA